jgi:hypothetical protein
MYPALIAIIRLRIASTAIRFPGCHPDESGSSRRDLTIDGNSNAANGVLLLARGPGH